jgi:hypothetical protein
MAPLFRVASCLLAIWLAPAAHSRPVDDLEPIVRELAIAKDVFRSAMSHTIGRRLKVTGVEAQYLVRQGVLVSMNVVQPWIDVDQFTDRSIELSTEVETLHDIPELVYEIMSELNIAIAPYDPELLEELRELRDEQRVLRSAQRQLRSQLREARRERNRMDEDTQDIDEAIAELELELNALVDEYDGLNSDIDQLYETIQKNRAQTDRQSTPLDIDQAVSETACNYGNTFKSLSSQEYLTVAVRLKEGTRYYVFKMENVSACRRGDIDAERLLERGWQYEV